MVTFLVTFLTYYIIQSRRNVIKILLITIKSYFGIYFIISRSIVASSTKKHLMHFEIFPIFDCENSSTYWKQNLLSKNESLVSDVKWTKLESTFEDKHIIIFWFLGFDSRIIIDGSHIFSIRSRKNAMWTVSTIIVNE